MADSFGAASLAEGRYSPVAMWFHWVIAGLIVANLMLGFLHEDFDRESRRLAMMVHKSIGLAVLALSIARLAWRLSYRPPAFDPVMKGWEMLLARTIHALFYVLMIGLPLSGWLLSSSGGRSTPFFDIVTFPPLPISTSDDSHDFWEEAHALLAWSMITLLALHVAGVLKHLFEGHRQMLGRMAPVLYRKR